MYKLLRESIRRAVVAVAEEANREMLRKVQVWGGSTRYRSAAGWMALIYIIFWISELNGERIKMTAAKVGSMVLPVWMCI